MQKLIDIFVEDNLTRAIATRRASRCSFLDQQLEQRQKALQEAEAKQAEFQARYLGSLPGTGSLTERIGGGAQPACAGRQPISPPRRAG